MPRSPASLPFAVTIFGSAFLLFLVQPIVAKQILPWFGGSAAVWTVCMVFFQSVLLAGYAYADALVRRATPRMQARVHAALLLVSVATLPIVADARWKPGPDSEPSLLILGLLVATVGLPYFVLSSTGPLLQAWVARAPWAARVYRLFSLSNAASLLALLAYPVALEPWWPLRWQALGWSAGYAAFAALCAYCAWQALRLAGARAADGPAPARAHADDAPAPPASTQALWLALPAMGSWLLLAVTTEITHNVASIPFLWIVPLSVYLATFILCFESDRWYRRGLWLPLGAAALVLAALELAGELETGWRGAVVLHVGALFVLCMVLHGETARRRPAHRHLTRFYLLLSAGGALGGAAVGLGAPMLLPSTYELGLGLALTAALGLALVPRRRAAVATAAALALGCSLALALQVRREFDDVRVVERNFYGTLRTYDTGGGSDDARRVLLHGGVQHGLQYLDAARRREPTAYYGRTAGIGRVLATLPPQRPARIGVVGLGAGTLAVYGRAGDTVRVYEIDPDVFALARREFSFIADSSAHVEDVPGDARLSMEREAPQHYDVLAIDAFSGGSVPVHLVTREALRVYLRHLAPQGVLAFHLTNRHLDLPPVVVDVARAEGLPALLVHDDAEDSDLRRTDWVLVARDASALSPFARFARPANRYAGARPWSDDFNNLLAILK